MERSSAAQQVIPKTSGGPDVATSVPSGLSKSGGRPGHQAAIIPAKPDRSPDATSSITTSNESGAVPDAILGGLFGSDPTGAARGDSDRAGLGGSPASAAQARSSTAGAILRGAPAPAAAVGSPVAQAAAPAKSPAQAASPGQATPTNGASSALTVAVAQSLGDGIRPMTTAPAPAKAARTIGVHPTKSVSPDMGSGGGEPDLPPSLDSYTFGIEPVDNDPGVYEAYGNTPIPIGASCALSATSPYGEENPIVAWDWSGGSAYNAYASGPASGEPYPNVPQPAPSPPATSNQTYGFIVVPTPDGIPYQVSVTVTYQSGTSSEAYLNFYVDTGAPQGSLSVKNPGTETVDPQGAVMVDANDPVQFSASFSVDQWTGGSFMFMQILITDVSTSVDKSGQSWYIANTAAFQNANNQNFNGPLLDAPNTRLAVNYGYYDNGYDYSWHLSVPSGKSAIPQPGLVAPYVSDSPRTNAPDPANDQSLRTKDTFSTYLMYKSDIQGSVWIAISKINWSWDETATNSGNGRWTGTPSQLTPGGATVPDGPAAFPYYPPGPNNVSWVNTAGNYLTLLRTVDPTTMHWTFALPGQGP